jgi:hypothetical protein
VYVANTTDIELLGNLSPGESRNLGGLLNSVYLPIYIWDFEYNGKNHSVYIQYNNNSFVFSKSLLKEKPDNMIQIKRK